MGRCKMDRSNIEKISQDPEDRLLLAKVLDRAEQAESRNVPAWTDFLSPQQQTLAQDLLRLAGRPDCRDRCAVVSLQTLTQDLAQAAFRLDRDYGIMTRVGLHCAPSAHRTLGTFPTGTIRFSFGWWNTEEDVAAALAALTEILSRPA